MRFYLFFLCFSLFSQEVKEHELVKFGFPLNTQNVEYSPAISPNGKYIVFQSNRPGGQGGMDFWLSENKNFRDRLGKAEWLEPVNLNEISSAGFEGPFSILFDEDGKPKEMFFTSQVSDSRNGYKGLNIYYSKRESAIDKWSVPIHLNDLNSDFDDKMPAISPDGKTMVFSSNRPGGYGGFDLWISERVSAKEETILKWSRPVNMGNKINTNENEIMPCFHFDNLTLYFSSDRKDEYHKFHFYGIDFEEDFEKESISDKLNSSHVPLRSHKFKEVYRLSKPLNSNLDDEGISMTVDGNWIYFSSNREGGEGNFDIYRIKTPLEMRKSYLFDFHGIVLDGSEEKMIGLSSTIKIYNEKGLYNIITSERIGGDISTTNPKNFQTKLLTNSLYKIEVSAPDFHPTEFALDLRGSVGFKKSKYVKIVLMPLEKDGETKKDNLPETKNTKETKDVKSAKEENAKDVKTPKETKGSIEVKTPKETKTFMNNLKVYLKDFETKKEISGGIVKIYTQNERNGISLKKEKEYFVIENRPKLAFEISGKAAGYLDETLIIKENEFLNQEIFEIYLKKSDSNNKVYATNIFFEFNEFELTKEQKKNLEPLVKFFKANLLDKFEIGGHTDNVAGKEFNLKLSENRANEVKSYFVSQGIDAKRITTKAYWYSQPLSEKDSDEGRAKNRRVSFKKIN
jgi:peptidoglycan-associated lipoprotein